MDIEQILKQGKGTIVDVRSYGEFMGGNVADSINIPLNEIPARLEELKTLECPVLFCCASGNRSGQAAYYCTQQGLDCANVGSWMDVNYYKSLDKEEV